MASPLADLLRGQADRLGARSYLVAARREAAVTFAGLAEQAADWSARLDAAGAGPGSTVGLAVTDPLALAPLLLGVIASGRWAAPLDPALPSAGPAGLLASAERLGVGLMAADRPAPGGAGCAWLDLLDPARATRSTEGVGQSGQGGVLLASSGTTGPPKTMALSPGQLLHAAAEVARHHELTGDDRCFCPLPLHHINGEVVGLLANLAAGSTVILDDRFHRTGFWALAARHRATWLNAVPAILARLAELAPGEAVPSGIRFARSASAPLAGGVLARFETATGIPVVETYGMTEAASQITANPVHGPRKSGSVGLPVGVELRLVADDSPAGDNSPAGDGAELRRGQVAIRGPSVITGYRHGHHADRFDPDGWLLTGDLGHLDDDGYLYLDGRTDDIINRGGEKYLPREVEEPILADRDVAAAAVVAQPDEVFGQVPVAYLVVRPSADRPSVVERVQRALAGQLARSRRPVAFHVVSRLPTGPNGKIRRHALGAGLPALYQLDSR